MAHTHAKVMIIGSGPHDGTLTHVEYLGADTFIYLEGPEGQLLTIRLDGQPVPAVGTPVRFGFDAAKLHKFGEDGRRLAA